METNYIPDAPSSLIINELQSTHFLKIADDYSFYNFIIDKERIVERVCAEYSDKIMSIVISTLKVIII